jgi:isoquinoline 1-oxidoreductase beta subunit
MNCTVYLQKHRCDIWVGTQAPTITQALVIELTGLPKDAIKIHNHLIGGGFGRRLEADGTVLAVKVAKHVDGPVKVIWSREEDIQHDMYRPYYLDRKSAGLDAAGKPVAWTHRIAGSSIFARYYLDAVEAAAEPPYALPNIHVDYVRVEPPGVRTSWWRGVGPTHNVFVVESFMDELAHAARSRILLLFARDCLVTIRERLLFCPSPRKKQGGDHNFPPGMAAGFRYNSPMEVTCRRSPRSKWQPMDVSKSRGSSVRLIAACTSIPIRSRPRFRGERFSG